MSAAAVEECRDRPVEFKEQDYSFTVLTDSVLLDEQARQQHCAPETLNAHFNNHFERTADSKPSERSMLLYTLYPISCLLSLIALTSFR